MSNIVTLPSHPQNSDAIEERACEWVACLVLGNLTENRQQELQRWLAEDPRHASSLKEMAELMDAMSVLSRLSDLFPLESTSPETPKPEWHFSCFPFNWIAATCCLLLLIGYIAWPFGRLDQSLIASTHVGESKIITLNDGSRITLNTSSQIRVNYSLHARHIELLQGEGLFDVAPDKSRPFYVRAGDTEVRAVGTVFNIELTDNRMELTVTEGIVEIDKPAAAKSTTDNAKVPQKLLVAGKAQVKAGEVAVIGRTVESLAPIDQASINKKLAWKTGQVIFEGETLEQVVAEISRYTTTTFFISDDGTRQIRIGGYFDIGNVDQMLDILQTGFNIKVTQDYLGVVHLSSITREDNQPANAL